MVIEEGGMASPQAPRLMAGRFRAARLPQTPQQAARLQPPNRTAAGRFAAPSLGGRSAAGGLQPWPQCGYASGAAVGIDGSAGGRGGCGCHFPVIGAVEDFGGPEPLPHLFVVSALSFSELLLLFQRLHLLPCKKSSGDLPVYGFFLLTLLAKLILIP